MRCAKGVKEVGSQHLRINLKKNNKNKNKNNCELGMFIPHALLGQSLEYYP